MAPSELMMPTTAWYESLSSWQCTTQGVWFYDGVSGFRPQLLVDDHFLGLCINSINQLRQETLTIPILQAKEASCAERATAAEARVIELQDEVKRTKELIKQALATEKSNHQHAVDTLRESLGSRTAKLEASEKEVKRLQKTLQEAEEQRIASREENDKLLTKLDDAKESIRKRDDQLEVTEEKLKDSLESWEVEKKNWEEEREGLNEKVEMTKAELGVEREKYKAEVVLSTSLRHNGDDLKDRLSQLSDYCTNLQQQQQQQQQHRAPQYHQPMAVPVGYCAPLRPAW